MIIKFLETFRFSRNISMHPEVQLKYIQSKSIIVKKKKRLTLDKSAFSNTNKQA